MSSRGPQDGQRGFTAVVGIALLIAVVIAGAAVILVFGGSATEDIREQAQVQAAADSLSEVSVALESSAGVGSTVEVSMPQWADLTKIESGHSTVTMRYNNDPACEATVKLGAVKYIQRDEQGQDAVTYLGGGIFRVSNGDVVLESPPALTYDEDREQVVFTAQQLRGGETSAELTGTRLVEVAEQIEQQKRAQLTEDAACAPRTALTLEVRSPYHEAWYTHLEEEMEAEGPATVSHEPGSNRVRVEFGGSDLAFDSDDDGFKDSIDNCPTVPNPTQRDVDGVNGGDACDPDDDGDGIQDGNDLCLKQVPPSWQDTDGDASPDHEDVDGDGLGNVCDPDIDGDGHHRPAEDTDGDGTAEFTSFTNPAGKTLPGLNEYYQTRYSPSNFRGEDNCPGWQEEPGLTYTSPDTYNPDQADNEGDSFADPQNNLDNDVRGGDVCDADDDNDDYAHSSSLRDISDNCQYSAEDDDDYEDDDGCPDGSSGTGSSPGSGGSSGSGSGSGDTGGGVGGGGGFDDDDDDDDDFSGGSGGGGSHSDPGDDSGGYDSSDDTTCCEDAAEGAQDDFANDGETDGDTDGGTGGDGYGGSDGSEGFEGDSLAVPSNLGGDLDRTRRSTRAPPGPGSVPGAGSVAPSVSGSVDAAVSALTGGLSPLSEPTCDRALTPDWDASLSDPTTFAGCYPTQSPDWQDDERGPDSSALRFSVQVIDFDD